MAAAGPSLPGSWPLIWAGSIGMRNSLRKLRESPTSIKKRQSTVTSASIRCSTDLFKSFARGSYERALPIGESRAFDTDCMFAALETVVEEVASRGNCVIVGRGSPYFLRNRPDAFHVFVYAPDDEKVRRLQSIGQTEKEALRLIGEIDRERADFIRHYFGKDWPYRPLYNMMINSKFGDEYVIESVLQQVDLLQKRSVEPSAAKV